MQNSRRPPEHMETPEYLAPYPENSASHAALARHTATARAERDDFPHSWLRRMMRSTTIATTAVALTCSDQTRLCLVYRDKRCLCESTLDMVGHHHSAPYRLYSEHKPTICVSEGRLSSTNDLLI